DNTYQQKRPALSKTSEGSTNPCQSPSKKQNANRSYIVLGTCWNPSATTTPQTKAGCNSTRLSPSKSVNWKRRITSTSALRQSSTVGHRGRLTHRPMGASQTHQPGNRESNTQSQPRRQRLAKN